MANIDLRNKAIAAIKQARSAPVCNPHPKAPHGFNRSASHSADRYVCDCEGWDAYDAGYQAGIEDTYKRMDALDKKAENARELGLDYEPVAIDANMRNVLHGALKRSGKVISPPAQPAPVQSCYCPNCEAMGKELAALKAQPAPVQEPQRYSPDGEGGMEVDSLGAYVKLQDVTTPPAAQRQWVGLTDDEIRKLAKENIFVLNAIIATNAKLKEKNESHRQHVTDGSPCWCEPETSYTDPETGASVIVHKEPQ